MGASRFKQNNTYITYFSSIFYDLPIFSGIFQHFLHGFHWFPSLSEAAEARPCAGAILPRPRCQDQLEPHPDAAERGQGDAKGDDCLGTSMDWLLQFNVNLGLMNYGFDIGSDIQRIGLENMCPLANCTLLLL